MNHRVPEPPKPPPAGVGSSAIASLLGFAAAAAIGGGVAWSSGCRNEPPPGPSADVPPRVSSLPAPTAQAKGSTAPAASAAPSALASASAAPSASASAAAAEKPYSGPLLGALAIQTPIYARPEYARRPIGSIRLGGKVPVEPGIVKDATGKCAPGWHKLVDGGYVCGKYSTLDIKSPQVRLGITPPNLDELLPYKYAHNGAHGTPLYRSVPSPDEMLKYEPYLDAAKRAKRKAEREKEKEKEREEAEAPAPAADDDKSTKADAIAKAEALGILGGGDPPPEEKKEWWEEASEKGKKVRVRLDDLTQGSDATLAKRMVKGFYVAIDKTFAWNNRTWYKTTAGLVAPADRMYQVKSPTAQGMDFPEGVKQLGFITANKASKYQWDAEKQKISVEGAVARFTPVGLTGATVTNKGTTFRQTTEGWWMKASDGTYTEPGPKPADLGPNEKWIDVNLTRKTLVALEGDKPIYGALVSPGKKAKDKDHDHSTVQGTFRIREKHVTTTMHGDSSLVSDLPYNIEDVPYVQYFEGSYALHAAFWHNNFGQNMSHGCVNLSPLDAKRVFLWSEPHLPRGWHAVWSTPENRGTLVVVHE